jgi:hypothetical protein
MKINIGHTQYDLKKVSGESLLCKPFDEDDEDLDPIVGGCCHPILNEIKINKDIPLQSQKRVFWHEATHAILDEIGMEELCSDEGFVDALSRQIYGVLKNNNVDKIYKFLEGGNSARI